MVEAVRTCYISGACNRVQHCLDWGKNDLICYGICNAVAIYDPKFGGSGTICKTLVAHSGRVNCVRWIKRADNGAEFEFVSTSSDKTAAIWKLQQGCEYVFKKTFRLEGHGDVVNVADAIYINVAKWHKLVATASSDCTIKIWTAEDETSGQATCLQTINLHSNFMQDIKFAFHGSTSVPFLVYGGSDTKLHLYVQNGEKFTKLISLAGHDDWIRAIDVMAENSGDLLIASCSQDCLIRLWRLSLERPGAGNDKKEIKLEGRSFKVADNGNTASFGIGLDAVISGHEGWIYGLHWHPKSNGDQPLQLLSASMDKTMILWEFDNGIGAWIEKVRVGEVGGNTLGFFGTRFGPSGKSMIAHGFQGAFHLWHFDQQSTTWSPGVTVGGHFDEVLDLDWDSGGRFLISASSDQTTRLHAPWSANGDKIWYEMARPQVHGYDMTCVTVIGRHRFASGADEKVLRAFEAPRNFIENFSRLSQVDLIENLSENNLIPEGASVPALGLSNKAIFEKTSQVDPEARHQKDIYPEAYFSATSLTEPPTEETLLQNTLWPELHKMYGHGYEIFCMASNREQTLLASACKASKSEHAKILIWSIATWKEIAQLSGHTLTVTQMEFSPCGQYLLSVSRDRTWSLHELSLTNDNELHVARVAYSDKATCKHSRIIWSCAWSHDSKYFVTGSRDKKVIVWGRHPDDGGKKSCLGDWGGCSSALELEDAVTAVACAPVTLQEESYLLAVGLESGSMYLYKWKCGQSTDWSLSHTFEKSFSHHLTVKRLRFSPVTNASEDVKDVIQLSSCGSDHLLYIYNVSWMLL